MYTPNITHTEDPEEPNVETENVMTSAVNQTSLFGFIEEEIANPVDEESILPQTSVGIRIVDGTDCLPGECPWQVQSSS